MKAVENFLKLKSELQSERTNATQLEAELRRLQDEYPVLESQFIEAEDPKVSAEIEKKMSQIRSRIEELPLLIKRSKRRYELLEEKLNRSEEEAIRELRNLYFPRLNSLVKKLVQAWRETGEVEREILQLREEAHRDLIRITPYPRVLVPAVPLFFVQKDETVVSINEFGPSFPCSKLKKMIGQLEKEGFAVKVQDED